MLSGAEEGAQGAPFESYKLAAVRLAEAVRLASRGNDSENDLVLELSGTVNRFLREASIALAFGNALEDLEGVPNFGLEFSELTTDGFAKDLQALPWISIRPYRPGWRTRLMGEVARVCRCGAALPGPGSAISAGRSPARPCARCRRLRRVGTLLAWGVGSWLLPEPANPAPQPTGRG